jgi:hypothetical protein
MARSDHRRCAKCGVLSGRPQDAPLFKQPEGSNLLDHVNDTRMMLDMTGTRTQRLSANHMMICHRDLQRTIGLIHAFDPLPPLRSDMRALDLSYETSLRIILSRRRSNPED